jgi:hypothetical protein
MSSVYSNGLSHRSLKTLVLILVSELLSNIVLSVLAASVNYKIKIRYN